jgi:hypothetical protein
LFNHGTPRSLFLLHRAGSGHSLRLLPDITVMLQNMISLGKIARDAIEKGKREAFIVQRTGSHRTVAVKRNHSHKSLLWQDGG